MFTKTTLTLLGLTTASLAGSLSTNVHVNQGCVLINNSPVCGGKSVPIGGGAASIYAMFGSNDQNPTALAGCHLNAQWPATYGDVFFGADNCLYDAKGHSINAGQCCSPGSGGRFKVINPYASK